MRKLKRMVKCSTDINVFPLAKIIIKSRKKVVLVKMAKSWLRKYLASE